MVEGEMEENSLVSSLIKRPKLSLELGSVEGEKSARGRRKGLTIYIYSITYIVDMYVESNFRQLGKSDCLGCAVLLCLV